MRRPPPALMCGPCYDGICESLGCAMPGLCVCECQDPPREQPANEPAHHAQCDMGEDCSCGASEQHDA